MNGSHDLVTGGSMKSNDPRLVSVTVDGQCLYVPIQTGWEFLRKEPDIDGMPLGALDLLWKRVEMTSQYEELTIGLAKFTFKKPRGWTFYVLLHTSTGQQRVHLQRVNCDHCGWQGWIANPTEVTLYIGAENEQQSLEKGWEYPVVPCIKCSRSLPLHAIWVEKIA